ncbi:MAG: DUF4147 domain-containing protein [Kofleriaceae bacterium]
MALRDELAQVFAAAVAACDPAAAVAAALAARPVAGPVRLLAVGKAAVAMASGAAAALGEAIVDGLVVHPGSAATPLPTAWDVRAAAHPVPDASSEAAGRAALAFAAATPPGHVLLVLVSGGASALWCVPRAGLGLADKVATITRALRSGAPIAELNRVRTTLSAVKGGQLAAACPAPVVTLVASDVPGDDPAVVGSGPTVPGKPGDRVEVVAGLGALAAAAARALRAAGGAITVEPVPLAGDVRAVAARLATAARGLPPGGRWVGGGEWTVALDGPVGRGGRASELALVLAEALAGTDRVALVGASDGVDGTGPDAGAIVDGDTWAALTARGVDPAAALARHDSGRALAALDLALCPGPTGVNHADLVVLARPGSVVPDGR